MKHTIFSSFLFTFRKDMRMTKGKKKICKTIHCIKIIVWASKKDWRINNTESSLVGLKASKSMRKSKRLNKNIEMTSKECCSCDTLHKSLNPRRQHYLTRNSQTEVKQSYGLVYCIFITIQIATKISISESPH